MNNSKAKIAGVIGWPVEHSLSPKLHGYWLRQYGIDGSYIPLKVPPEELESTLMALPEKGICGVNLTIPHKEAAMDFLSTIDDTAGMIGAVNTVVVKEGKLHGSNTDAYGFAENIRPYITGKKKAVVLGAGGAAKAVCYALLKEGFAEIVVTNRTREKSDHMAKHLKFLHVAAWEERSALLEDADLLVNTTSLGLAGKEALEIDLARLHGEALVTDIVYHPLITPLLERAKARGNPVVDGLGMLLHQAVPGFEAWFGVRPEVTPKLRRYVLDA